jgi:Restriction endonuclease fold toxin 5
MAGLAVPLIEAAAVRVLTALGVGVAAGAAGEATKEEVRKRQEEADKAKASPIARTDAQTKPKEKCKECPPDKGAPVNRSTAGWSEVSIAYQARIGGLPVGPGFITEWMFGGVTFDGFDSSQCLLKEAKGRYDQFFDDFGSVRTWWLEGRDDLVDEAMRQGVAAQPRPPTRLRWHFMQPISYRFFSRIILAAYPDVEVVFQP